MVRRRETEPQKGKKEGTTVAEGEGFEFENWLPVFQGNFKHRYHRISLFLGWNTTFPVSELVNL